MEWEFEAGSRYVLLDILAGPQSGNIKKIFGNKPRTIWRMCII